MSCSGNICAIRPRPSVRFCPISRRVYFLPQPSSTGYSASPVSLHQYQHLESVYHDIRWFSTSRPQVPSSNPYQRLHACELQRLTQSQPICGHLSATARPEPKYSHPSLLPSWSDLRQASATSPPVSAKTSYPWYRHAYGWNSFVQSLDRSLIIITPATWAQPTPSASSHWLPTT